MRSHQGYQTLLEPEAAQRLLAALAVVGKAHPKQVAALILRNLIELPRKDVAAILGVSDRPATINDWIEAVSKALKAELPPLEDLV